jgi:hypothetical protein
MTLAKDSSTREKILETIYTVGNEALKDPKVLKALGLSGPWGTGATLAKAIAESSFDVYAQWQSFQRIRQANENADEFLKAVRSLSDHMVKLVTRINQIKQELGQ